MSKPLLSHWAIIAATISVLLILNYMTRQTRSDFPTVEQLLELNNYHSINHNVITEDGYFITLQRIVPKDHDSTIDRKAVIIVPGMFVSSNIFLFQPPHVAPNSSCSNIVFCLLQTGRYDVWIPNLRGTDLSNKHVRYSTNHPQYWNYSFEDMAMYDLPAVMDYIRKHTNTKHRMAMIGYSMGGTIQTVFMTMRPEYSAQIHPYIAWSPAVFINESQSYLDIVKNSPQIPWPGMIRFVFNLIHRQLRYYILKFLPTDFVARVIAESSGRTGQYNKSLIPFFWNLADPSGEKSYVLDHYFSILINKKFVQFHANKHLRLTIDPPEKFQEYSWSNIPKNLTVLVMYGSSDTVATPQDTQRFVAILKENGANAHLYRIKSNFWNHINFVTGSDAHRLVIHPTMKFLDKYYD